MSMAPPLKRSGNLQTFTLVQGAVLVALVIGSVAWFAWLGHVFDWPMEPRFSPSLFLSLHPLRAMVIVLIGGAACVFAGSLILGRIKPDAGLFLAGCGLARLAALAGPVGVMVRSRLTAYPNWVMFVGRLFSRCDICCFF